MRYDYHVHSTYSDGSAMEDMLGAAREAGLEGVGFADHCNVSDREPGTSLEYDFDETYPERRDEIRGLRDAFDLGIVDAVELDYRPEDEERIRAFLEEANFELAIGSVHHVERREVMAPAAFAEEAAGERALFVDRYFDLVVDLIESELFDVVAHLDVTERNPHLRGQAASERYRDVAESLAASRTVPELNAGRVFSGPREIHPHPEFVDALQEEGVQFVTGTDSHHPEEVADRAEYIEELVQERGIDVIELA